MKFITDNFKYQENYKVCGLTKELNAIYIANYFNTHNENVLVLTSTLYEANNFYKSIKTYVDACLLFPMDDFLVSVAIAISPDLKLKRLETLDKLRTEKKKHIVITSLMGYLKYLPNRKEKQKIIIKSDNEIISREIIIDTLEKFSYHKDSLVTVTGEYAVRGFIIDIFPLDYEHPVRIELFGDTIENIKEFDENTQMSIKDLDNIEIKTFSENISSDNESILDYLNRETLFLIDENQIRNSYTTLQSDILEYNKSKNLNSIDYMFSLESQNAQKTYKIETLNTYQDAKSIIYESKEIDNWNSDMNSLVKFCNENIKTKTIIFSVENKKQIQKLQEIFTNIYITNAEKIYVNKINIIENKINHGFIFQNYIIITPYDIDKTIKQDIKYKNNLRIGRKIKTFNDLNIGDYIVHEIHGIGIYKGLKTLKNGEYTKDYIELEYLDKDKVYIPIENINKLYKYTQNIGNTPKLSKLNSAAWAKKKNETRKKIRDISNELIELYSNRKNIIGEAYKDYEEEEIKFAFAFPYTLTKDQDYVIKEIDMDLKSVIPMDRLLCGDVGYGKTEVAFRAMFKTVLNNRQVSYLCPTTILSKQQYTSACERFKDFPIRIELLNRFVSTKKTNEILKDLKDGKIDIIIGTHKLLNEKIEYKHLGLLVIDEEQRFGVSHKEKLKKLKTDVNVLTLSATPIPRTLKMAMSGLRNLSVLDTPPIDRYPVQTYVIEENDLLIRDAIYKELTRNGQVFILINNIESLEKYKKKISELVKEARIICGHGRMTSDELSRVMESFVKGEYDILICTTIIETGIDIPNVNTIIIINSDQFGLSQLYQIRGRVGRSNKIAYAYLMYNPAKILTETATKRLESIKEFTELGSGYKIAMRDLAIRGAGDLLGSEQAGFIDAVGLDLYTKMVDEEVKRKERKIIEEENENTTPSLNTNTTISNTYVDDENIKIEIHKMINSIKNKIDFNNVKIELEDRFGKIDENIEIYMLKKCTEELLKTLKIENIIQKSNLVTITLPEDLSNKIDGEKLFLTSYNICPKFSISYRSKKIIITLNTNNLEKNYIYYIYDLLNTFLNL